MTLKNLIFITGIASLHLLMGCEPQMTPKTRYVGARLDTENCKRNPAYEGCQAVLEEHYQESVLFILKDGLITNATDAAISWQLQDGLKVEGFQAIVSKDPACTDTVAEFSNVSESKVTMAGVAEGNYFVCLFAIGANGNKLPAANNGIKLVVDRTPPQVLFPDRIIINKESTLQPKVNDLTGVTVVWTTPESVAARLSELDNPYASFGADQDGDYTLEGTFTDQAGNETKVVVPITWDTVAPLVELGPDIIIGNPTTVAPQVDPSDVISYDWQVLTSPANAQLQFDSTNIMNPTIAATGNGSYRLKLTVSDRAGNTASDELLVQWSNSQAVFTSIALLNEAADGFINAGEAAGSADLVGNLVAQDYDKVSYAVVPQATTCAAVASWSTSVPKISDVTADGAAKVCVKLEDTQAAASTPAYGASAGFTRDTLAPAFTSIALAGDAADGFLNAVERAATTPIVQSLVAIGYDTIAYKLVGAANTCSSESGYGPSAPTANATDFGGDGSYKVCLKLSDNAANPVAYGESGAFQLDTGAPVFTSLTKINEASDGVVNAAEKNGTSALFLLASSGNTSAAYTNPLNESTAQVCNASQSYGRSTIPAASDFPASDGTYSVCVRLADDAGNVAYGKSELVAVDVTVPQAVIQNAPSGASSMSNLAITISGTGVVEYKYKIAAEPLDCSLAAGYGAATAVAQNIGDDISAFAEGGIRLCVVGADSAGNWQIFADASSATWTKDVTLPTVSIDSLIITAANASAVNLTGSCSENGRIVTIGGAVSSSATCSSGTWAKTLDYSGIADGLVSVTADHDDSAGNNATQATASLAKDTGVPTVSLNAVVINAANAAAVNLTGNCSENGRTVSIGGAVASSATCGAGTWAKTVDYSAIADGNVSITADHDDVAGNQATQATLNATKDTIVPTVTITPVTITAANVAAVPLSGSCSENGRTVTIGGAVSSSATCSGGAWAKNLDYSGIADGSVSVTADLDDAAGNPATQATANLTKDVNLPTVSITSFVINLANAASVNVTGSCSENGRTVTIGGALSLTATCSAGSWSKIIDYSAVADGNVSVTADHDDAASNAATQATFTATKDTVVPTVAITPIVINAANASAVNLTGSCSENGRTVTIGGAVLTTTTCSGGAWSKTIDYSGAADGNVSVTADISDAAGNAATQASASLSKDTSLPTVSIADVVINAGNASAVNLTGSCSENGRTVTIGGAVSSSATCSAGSWSKTIDYSAAADGTVNVTADLDDAAGNAATQATRALTKDTLIPTVTVSGPSIGSANVTAVTLSGNCSENGRTVTIGGAVLSSATCSGGTWSKIVDFSGVPDGNANVTADADDAAGNQANQASTSLTKDTDAPAVSIQPIVINIANGASVSLSGSCSENGESVVIGGALSSSATCSGGSWSKVLNYSAVADGNVAITADHSDSLGNDAPQATYTATKDTVAPTVSVTPVVINAANASAVNLTGNCSENGRTVTIGGAVSATSTCGAGTWTKTLDYSSAADGTVNVTVDLSDAAGNDASQSSINITKDVTLPTVGINAVIITAANASAVNLTGSCSENGRTVTIGGAVSSSATCSSGTWAKTLDYSGVADGLVSVTADHDDSAGNNATQATASLAKDTGVPSVSLNAVVINAANAGAVNLTGNCSENGRTVSIGGAVSSSATCSAGTWSKTVNYSAVADGSVNVTADHDDVAGNVATQAALNLTKDTVVPTVTITPVTITAANVAAVPLSGSCSENGRTVTIGGAVSSSATCSGGAWAKSLDYSGIADGNVSVTADLDDAAGNPATQATANLTKDVNLPTVSITSFVINLANAASVNVTGSCSENGRTVTIGGAVSSTATCSAGAWAKSIDYSGVADGNVSVTADHDDAASNAATQATYTATKDTVVPTVAITPIVINAANASAVNLTGSCSENGRTVTIGGAVLTTTTCSGGAWSKTIDYSAAADGNVSVTADISDAAGNAATQASASLSKDTSLPTVSIADVVINAGNASAVNLTGSCSENGRTVTIGGAVSSSATCSAGSWSKTIDYSAAADGTVNVTADLDDAAGNAAIQATRALTKDTVPPTISINAVVIHAGNATSVPLNGSCSEAGRTVTIGGAASSSTTCSGGSWSVNVNYGAQADGLVNVTADISDAAGNGATQASASLTKDTVAPVASLSGQPTGLNNLTSLNVTVAGADVTQYMYKVGDGSTDCSNASGYSAATAVATPITASLAAISDGTVILCAVGRDTAGNWQTYASASSASWTKDTQSPTFTSIDLINNASDGYIALAERSSSNALVGNLNASGHDAVSYALVPSATACSGVASWSGTIPASNSGDFGGDGSYKVCVKLTDATGNPATYGASSAMTLDTSAPSFTSLNGANEAVNLVIGTAELNSTNPIASLSASDYVTANYTAIQLETQTCDAGQTYGSSSIPLINTMPGTDGNYSVCVKLLDAAGNATYGKSQIIARNTVMPTVNVGADFSADAQASIDASSSGATSYQWSKVSGPGTVTFGTPTAEDTTVSANTDGTYVLRLTVTNSSSGNSASDDVTMTWSQGLAVPGSLTISAATPFSQTLTWTDRASAETGYRIERSKNAGTTWQEIAVTAANATSYKVTAEVRFGTTYHYRVRATNGGSNGPYTATVNGATTDIPNLGFESGNVTSWTLTGSPTWTTTTSSPQSGTYTSVSGTIGHSASTCMERNVTIAADESAQTLSFYWSVSSESGYDYLRFYVNGASQGQISGSVGWTRVIYTLAAGASYTLKWCYSKDGSATGGSDRGWVDSIDIYDPNTLNGENLGFEDDMLHYTSSGNANWTTTTSSPQEGTKAAISGTITHSQSTCMERLIYMAGAPANKTLTFYWSVSSEGTYDLLRFYIDGTQQHTISGSVSWTQRSYTLTAGSDHTIKWCYTKDGSVSSGSDRGWVDNITLQ